MEQNKFINIILDNIRKVFYPEEWLDIDLNLSKSELFTMLIVERYGEVIMSKMADEINVSMSTATGIVNRLVRKGYLERARSEKDRRIVVIRLSKSGKEIVDNLKQTMNYYLNTIYESLTEEEIQVLNRIILKIIGAFSKENSKRNLQKESTQTIKKIDIE